MFGLLFSNRLVLLFLVERKLDEELEDGSHMGLGFKPGSEIKPGENKPQEPIQMSMSFSKVCVVYWVSILVVHIYNIICSKLVD